MNEKIQDAKMGAGDLLAVGTEAETYLFHMTNSSLEEVQRLNQSSWGIEFSADGQHLVSTGDNQLTVYHNQLF